MPIVEATGIAIGFPKNPFSKMIEQDMVKAILDSAAAGERAEQTQLRIRAALKVGRGRFAPASDRANVDPDPKPETPIDTGAQAADVPG